MLSYWSFQADAALPKGEPYTVFPDGCASVALVRTGKGQTYVKGMAPVLMMDMLLKKLK